MRSPKSRKEGSMRINGRRMMMARLLDDMFARIDDAVAREIILKNWGEADGKHVLVSKLAAVTNIGSVFKGSAIESVNWMRYFTNLKILEGLFENCTNLTDVDLSFLNVSNVTRFGWAFSGCSNLKHIKLNGWDAGKGNNIQSMFEGCSSLTEIDLSGWKNAGNNITDNSYTTFSGLKSLNILNLSGWTNTTMSTYAFYFSKQPKKFILYGCPAETVDFWKNNAGNYFGSDSAKWPTIYTDDHIWKYADGKWNDISEK